MQKAKDYLDSGSFDIDKEGVFYKTISHKQVVVQFEDVINLNENEIVIKDLEWATKDLGVGSVEINGRKFGVVVEHK